jgi:glycine cleavage system regulatory protein
MTPLVLTIIGDDRAGLVRAVAAAVAEHGGNWNRSQMTELAGKFAGIVLVTLPDHRVEEFTAALEPLNGLLDVTIQRATAPPPSTDTTRWTLQLLGSDRPGIVSDVTTVLNAHGVSIDALTTDTREAPMTGGLLFEATATLDVPRDADIGALQRALEDLANELMVDIDFDAPA